MSVYESKPWLARYADHVPAELPLPEKSMADLFEESLDRRSERANVERLGFVSLSEPDPGQLGDLAILHPPLVEQRARTVHARLRV